MTDIAEIENQYYVRAQSSLADNRTRVLGRPTKFSPELWEKLCDLLAQGLTVEHACAHMDIHRDTFAAWRRDPTAKFRLF